jgi:hypothetical protein
MPRLGPSGEVGCQATVLCIVFFIAPGVALAYAAAEMGGSDSAAAFIVGLVICGGGAALLASNHPARAVTRPRRRLLTRNDFRPKSAAWSFLRGAMRVAYAAGFVLLLAGLFALDWSEWAGLVVIALAGLFRGATSQSAVGRTPRLRRHAPPPEEPWLHDVAWDERGEQRGFWRYLSTRWMFMGRFAVLFEILALRLPSTNGCLAIQFALGAASSAWLWRVWRVFGMGTVRLGFRRFPMRAGGPAEFTFEVSPGGADIRGATFTLRHFRESADADGPGGGLPMCDLAIVETGDPPPRLVEAGLGLPISFDVPASAPGTDVYAASPAYWEFEVVGATREGLYEERFLVPLYAAAAAAGSA